MDALVTNFVVKPGIRFNANGTTTRLVVYTFNVGDHGPFTLTYAEGTDATAKVQMDIQATVQKLRDVGALAPY